MKSTDKIQDSIMVSVRLRTICKANGIETFGDLIDIPRNNLLRLRNFGRVTLQEIDELRSKVEIVTNDKPIAEPFNVTPGMYLRRRKCREYYRVVSDVCFPWGNAFAPCIVIEQMFTHVACMNTISREKLFEEFMVYTGEDL